MGGLPRPQFLPNIIEFRKRPFYPDEFWVGWLAGLRNISGVPAVGCGICYAVGRISEFSHRGEGATDIVGWGKQERIFHGLAIWDGAIWI